MTILQKTWDFIYGMILIGGAPLAAIFLLSYALSPMASALEQNMLGWYCARAILIGVLFGTWFLVVLHRFRHRLLPSWILVLEVVVGFVGAMAYIALYMAVGQE
jgi:hypothetical protein